LSTPHDPELVTETRAWLIRAERDLAAAAHELTAQPPFVEDIVFHAQQAAEKTFKAFLAWHGRPFRKTHSLEELGEQCLEIEPNLELIVDRAVPLTDYAWKFRYPGELEAPTREEAEGALATAREVFEAILASLPNDVHP
jgi:HEPN domain-containing protein